MGCSSAVLSRRSPFSIARSWFPRCKAGALQKGNDRYARTINASPDAIVVANLDGLVLDFNPAAADMFGYTREQAIGQRLETLIVPPRLRSVHAAGMERYRGAGEGNLVGRGRVETTAMKADGTEFPIE